VRVVLYDLIAGVFLCDSLQARTSVEGSTNTIFFLVLLFPGERRVLFVVVFLNIQELLVCQSLK